MEGDELNCDDMETVAADEHHLADDTVGILAGEE